MKRSLGTSIIFRLWTIQSILPTAQLSALATGSSKLAFLTMASSRQQSNHATDSQQTILQAQQDSTKEKSAVTWKLYPMESYHELTAQHGKDKVKVIHMVRHAEGTHNVEMDYKNLKNLDARLTELGMTQCESLAQHSHTTLMEALDPGNVAVITSPMTRCVQTALYSFPWLAVNPGVPFVALESIRETVNYACDRRRDILEIAKEFGRVDFSPCREDEDYIWEAYRNRLGPDWDTHMESAELYQVARRAREGLEYLQSRPEHHLVVCSHSAFLRCMLNWGQEGGVPQLMPQVLDERSGDETTTHKIFEYCGPKDWEQRMRSNYDNCEMRSFCMLVQDVQ